MSIFMIAAVACAGRQHDERSHRGRRRLIWISSAAVVIFAFQDLQLVTMSFLGFSARVPLALLAVGIFLLGTLSGGSLIALLRKSFEGAKRPVPSIQ